MTVKWFALGVFSAIAIWSQPSNSRADQNITWAAQDDAATLDPHAFNHGMTMTVLSHVYEGLVRRNRQMVIEPALAESWHQPEPDVWRFILREGVTFHDGTPFTADDVVFSFERAMSEQSDMSIFTASIVGVVKVDEQTIDILTEFPNAALIQSLPEVRIMSRIWSEANSATQPARIAGGAENFATTNTNGTGPFVITERQPEVRTVFKANEAWWDQATHGIDTATLVRITSGPTRVAALISGEVDFAYPIPLQDIPHINASADYRVLTGPEIRTMFLSMDQEKNDLAYDSINGVNPFSDQRVRQAIYQGINVEAITERIMRGAATPTGNLMAPSVNSVAPELQQREYPYDPDAARRLLSEAGFDDGFSIVLDCPNDRYVNDEEVCQAIASMLARIGIDVDVNGMPAAQFFPKVGARDSSFNFFGYTPVNLDAYNTLSVIVHSPINGRGQWNVGNFSNNEVDSLIEQALSEMDQERRTDLVTQAMKIHRSEVGHIPLYQQGLAWGMRNGVDTPLQIDNRVNLTFFTLAE